MTFSCLIVCGRYTVSKQTVHRLSLWLRSGGQNGPTLWKTIHIQTTTPTVHVLIGPAYSFEKELAVLDVLVAVLFAFVSNHPRSPSGFHTNYRSKVPTRNDENIRMHLKSSILKRRPTALTSSRRAIRFIWRSSGWEVANPGRTINVFRREEIIFLEK